MLHLVDTNYCRLLINAGVVKVWVYSRKVLILLLIWLPLSQKIFHRVFCTPGCRCRPCEYLPWWAQIVTFNIGPAFLLRCVEEGSKLIYSGQDCLTFLFRILKQPCNYWTDSALAKRNIIITEISYGGNLYCIKSMRFSTANLAEMFALMLSWQEIRVSD